MRQDANGTMFALVSGNNISLVSSHGIVLNGQDATVDDVPRELEATITGNTTVVNARHRSRRKPTNQLRIAGIIVRRSRPGVRWLRPALPDA